VIERHRIEAALEVLRRDSKFSERVEARGVIFDVVDECDRLRVENARLRSDNEALQAVNRQNGRLLFEGLSAEARLGQVPCARCGGMRSPRITDQCHHCHA